MSSKTTKLTIDIELTRCAEEWDATPQAEGETREIGHMHFWGVTANITSHHKQVGQIGMDLGGGTLLFDMNGETFHVPSLEVWKAVYDAAHKAGELA